MKETTDRNVIEEVAKFWYLGNVLCSVGVQEAVTARIQYHVSQKIRPRSNFKNDFNIIPALNDLFDNAKFLFVYECLFGTLESNDLQDTPEDNDMVICELSILAVFI